MKKSIVVTFLILFAIVLIRPSMASPDPSHVLYVKPTSGGGTGPYVITSPATLEIGIKASAASVHNTVTDIWLILILNDDTHANLVKITTNVTSQFLPGDFINPDDIPESRIPRTSSGQYDPLENYPGYEFDEQYTVNALESHIYGSDSEPIWYFVRKTTIGSIMKTSPATLTLTVNAPGATEMKVMVLAIGYSYDFDANDGTVTGELNESTSLSEYTFVVPEIATVLLALAPIAGLGLYTYKQKKTNKNIA